MSVNRFSRTSISHDDLAHCRDAMRIGSKSFYMASRLLPADVRDATIAVYAFCRLSDDAVDDGNDGMAAVDMLRRRLDGIYAGKPASHPVDRAVSATVQAYDIPRDVLDALIEGMEWDARGRRYETFDDICAYGVRVAGSVGMLVCCIMRRRDPDVLARACDLGVAMQLTNIARDIGEDAGRGRLYLPADWMRDAGLDPDAWLASPVYDSRLASVVDRLLAEADEIYRRAEPAVAALPMWCRPAILMARHCYAEIGQEVRRAGNDSVTRRAVVSKRRKLWMLSRVANSIMFPQALDDGIKPILSARVLINDVAINAVAANGSGAEAAWWQLGRRLDQTLELLLQLEYADQARDRDRVAERGMAR